MQDRDIDGQHVYMVDTHASYPPVSPRLVSPRPSPPSPGVRAYQVLVLVLLGLMFCGMTVQAVFLYRLSTSTSTSTSNSTSTSTPADSPSYSRRTHGAAPGSPAARVPVKPSKPAAHLTDGHNIHHGNEMLSWSTEGDSFLHRMKYCDGLLSVRTEGFYFIYSKVFYQQHRVFHHTVSLRTSAYPGPIALLKSREYSEPTQAKSNSYLGGVFHLRKGETLSVEVNGSSQVIQAWPNENFFGAYMI